MVLARKTVVFAQRIPEDSSPADLRGAQTTDIRLKRPIRVGPSQTHAVACQGVMEPR
jgi:hypothetical protein